MDERTYLPVESEVGSGAGPGRPPPRMGGEDFSRFRRSAFHALDSRKQRLALEIEGFAGLIEDMGRTLGERGRLGQRRYVDRAGIVTRRFSRALREKRADELLDSAVSAAESKPGAVLAGAIALGFLGLRLLRK